MLKPRWSRWIPNMESRSRNHRRITEYTEDRFETYEDYFFFQHVDPCLRFWHVLGMFAGAAIYAWFAYLLFVKTWGLWIAGFYLAGTFFFYGFGLFSHLAYDGGGGKTKAKYFFASTLWVIRFNLDTAFGRYDKTLRRFVAKYPFVVQAYDLVES